MIKFEWTSVKATANLKKARRLLWRG